MKIALMSDIHAEFYRPTWLPPLPVDADVLVLGGDIHVGLALIEFVHRISEALPETDLVVVAGNHEFYRQHRNKTLALYRNAFLDHDKIHFLENDYVDIQGVRFVGATLWTGFPMFDERFSKEKVMNYAKDTVTDFHCIVEDPTSGKTEIFSPQTAENLFHESLLSIDAILMKSDPQRTVAVTHFPPLKSLRNPRFVIDKISSYFTADCSYIANKHMPAFWIYGHNHWSANVDIGGTTFISNQLGYPDELWKTGGTFDPNLIVRLRHDD